MKVKKITKRIVPVIMSLVIVCGTVFSSYEQVQATGLGVTEVIYYTYWDLISTIYAQCGYSTSVDPDVINNHGVTGKQVWDNFCTSVENTAKFHYGILDDAKNQALKDLKNLATTATAKGIKLTQDLYDMLRDVFKTQSSDVGLSDYSDRETTFAFINSLMGITDAYTWSGGTVQAYDIWLGLKSGYNLNLIEYGSTKCIFTSFGSYVDLRIDKTQWGYGVYYSYDASRYYAFSSTGYTANSATLKTSSQGLDSIYIEPHWIIKNGSFYTDTTVKAAADSVESVPAKAPDVTPWHKAADVPDSYRTVKVKQIDDNTVYVPGVGTITNWDLWKDSLKDRTTTDAEEELWNSQYHFDDDGDGDGDKDPDNKANKDDRLPVAIPIFSQWGTKPDPEPGTEEPGTEPGKDPDKKPDSSETAGSLFPLINPDTGNYIDPETGFDIDPKTGKLIDPKTGELVDPGSVPGAGGGGAGGDDLTGQASKYGNITEIFPFCIPFDIVRLIKGMKADEAPPVFHFEHHFDSIDYTFTVDVDLSDYLKYIKIFRFGIQVFYVIALMFLTVKVSKLFI